MILRNGPECKQGEKYLEFCHKDGEQVPGAQMAGLKKAPAWFLRKKERPVVFLGGLEG